MVKKVDDIQTSENSVVARRSPVHGTGVFAIKPIPKGARIIEYKGRRVLWSDHKEKKNGHTELFHISAKYVLDPSRDGNDARYINHSCAPNCETMQDGERVFVFALRNIKPGEELFYDYGLVLGRCFTREEALLHRCRCGSRNCRGTMLAVPPSRRAQVLRWAAET
ncbi:MAG: SET domain-containing protein-lysine N-methyltransferase [Kiritimatiellae bacterium]|nr:SET domain-containing protein-lysine N-methyltransferase [Kiritimatiellia bacterium]